MYTRRAIIFLASLVLQILYQCQAFVPSSILRYSYCQQEPPLFVTKIADESESEPSPANIQDKNGKPLSIGSVVRVAKEGLKAYQVPPKGRGTFNDDKEFVPAPSNGERATKCLVIPEGMHGVVTKIIAAEALSANFPVAVQFVPGENSEEGYDPPVRFAMHFGATEIECV